MNTPPLPTVGRIPFFLAAPEDRLHVLAAAIARAARRRAPIPPPASTLIPPPAIPYPP